MIHPAPKHTMPIMSSFGSIRPGNFTIKPITTTINPRNSNPLDI